MRKRHMPAFLLRMKQRRWAARLEVPAGWAAAMGAAHDKAFRIAKALPLMPQAPAASLTRSEIDQLAEQVMNLARNRTTEDFASAEAMTLAVMRLLGPFEANAMFRRLLGA